jgi:hypothetical protein
MQSAAGWQNSFAFVVADGLKIDASAFGNFPIFKAMPALST